MDEQAADDGADDDDAAEVAALVLGMKYRKLRFLLGKTRETD